LTPPAGAEPEAGLRIHDNFGKPVAFLESSRGAREAAGSGGLRLLGSGGGTITFGVGAQVPGLAISDGGAYRVLLGPAAGASRLLMVGNQGQAAATLEEFRGGQGGRITVYHPDGANAAQMASLAPDGGRLAAASEDAAVAAL